VVVQSTRSFEVFRRVPRAGVKRERGAADNGQSLCCPRNGKCARAYQPSGESLRFAQADSPATVSERSREGDTPDPTSPETGLKR